MPGAKRSEDNYIHLVGSFVKLHVLAPLSQAGSHIRRKLLPIIQHDSGILHWYPGFEITRGNRSKRSWRNL
jgi:hypothetical protein